MSYLVLARKWRPKQFDEVVGQRPITQTLKNSISSGRIAHAYLFAGPRGVGKTTTARILAKALNCKDGPIPRPCDVCILCNEINRGVSVDVVEIDGASNNSVDDIRDLREKVHYLPAKGRYKVYIIDEVHMLSNQAFNALLKTLEEPPNHIVFVLATTEVHKIPLTILSRCQRYDFRRISSQDIRAYLDNLLKEEGDLGGEREDALRVIAKYADGSLRDALSLTDQVISFSGGKISLQEVLDLVSLVERGEIENLLKALVEGKQKEALLSVEKVVDRGHNLKQFVEQILHYIRDIIIFKLSQEGDTFLDLSKEEVNEMEKISKEVSQEDLLRYFEILSKAAEKMRLSSQPRLILEMSLIRMAELPKLESLRHLIQRLELLEQAGAFSSGSAMPHHREIPLPEKPALQSPLQESPPFPQGEMPRNTLQSSIHAPLSGENTIGESSLQLSPEPVTPGIALSSPESSPSAPLEGMQEVSSGDIKCGEISLDWKKVIQEVKGKSMLLGSLLEHLNVSYQDDREILELAMRDDNPFYLQLIEDPKNQALLRAELTRASGKNLNIQWTAERKKEFPSAPPPIKGEKIDNQSLHLINKEPIIQMAMDIFSAEIVKTTMAKESEYEENGHPREE